MAEISLPLSFGMYLRGGLDCMGKQRGLIER